MGATTTVSRVCSPAPTTHLLQPLRPEHDNARHANKCPDLLTPHTAPPLSSTPVKQENRNMAAGGHLAKQYEHSERRLSSVVIAEHPLHHPMPNDGRLRYVEVPVIQEVVRHVPKRSVVEVEKVVPRYEVEYVDRIVEVPQIKFVDRRVERPKIQEVIRHVPVKYVHEVPKEVVCTVPQVEVVRVEKRVEVPGPVVEVPKPYLVEKKVKVNHFVDRQIPVVVAQTLCPVVTCPAPGTANEGPTMDVDVYEYEPEVIPVEVQVAKPVPSQLIARGATETCHQPVTVPPAQFNSLLRALNKHLGPEERNQDLPYVREPGTGTVTFLREEDTPGVAIFPLAQNGLPFTLKHNGNGTPNPSVISGYFQAARPHGAEIPVTPTPSVVNDNPASSSPFRDLQEAQSTVHHESESPLVRQRSETAGRVEDSIRPLNERPDAPAKGTTERSPPPSAPSTFESLSLPSEGEQGDIVVPAEITSPEEDACLEVVSESARAKAEQRATAGSSSEAATATGTTTTLCPRSLASTSLPPTFFDTMTAAAAPSVTRTALSARNPEARSPAAVPRSTRSARSKNGYGCPKPASISSSMVPPSQQLTKKKGLCQC